MRVTTKSAQKRLEATKCERFGGSKRNITTRAMRETSEKRYRSDNKAKTRSYVCTMKLGTSCCSFQVNTWGFYTKIKWHRSHEDRPTTCALSWITQGNRNKWSKNKKGWERKMVIRHKINHKAVRSAWKWKPTTWNIDKNTRWQVGGWNMEWKWKIANRAHMEIKVTRCAMNNDQVGQ